MSTNEYETVATVESMSKPGKFYTIKLNRKDGQVSCNCPSWIFQKGVAAERKPCKHIRNLEKVENAEPMRELLTNGRV